MSKTESMQCKPCLARFQISRILNIHIQRLLVREYTRYMDFWQSLELYVCPGHI